MFVYKRDGRKERVQFDKITARVSRLCYGLDPDHVVAETITQKVKKPRTSCYESCPRDNGDYYEVGFFRNAKLTS